MASSSENPSTLSLCSLPAELLQQIARSCPCSAALNLTLVNRQLRAACRDHLVFRYIAENAHKSKKLIPQSWKEASILLEGASLRDTLQIARTIEKALTLPKIEDRDSAWLPIVSKLEINTDIEEWLPHLTALRHPACLQTSPLYYLAHLRVAETEALWARYMSNSHEGSRERFNTYYTNLLFCLAATTLDWRRSRSGILIREIFFVNLGDDPAEEDARLISQMFNRFIYDSNHRIPRVRSFHAEHVAYATLLPMITAILGDGDIHYLPSVDRTPFYSFMDISSLYHNTTSSPFRTCHLRKMCTPEFLSGSWMGYCWRHIRLDPPMDLVRLDTSYDPSRPSDEEDSSIVVDGATSGGRDRHGDYRLTGSISVNGEVRMTKSYIGHPGNWAWAGRVTPLGIVGAWGSDSEARVEGQLWIWKREWSRLYKEP